MIEARRRPAGSQEHTGVGLRSSSQSSSGTPLEGDDDTPRRSTRGRNPLPPTSGPLFPPLPPKQPKQRGSSHSKTPSSSIPPAPAAAPQQPPAAAESILSGASLTPPPATSSVGALDDDAEAGGAMDVDAKLEMIEGRPANGEEEDQGDWEGGREGDDWDVYRRHRSVKGFSQARGDAPTVKDEPIDEPSDVVEQSRTVEESPTKTRAGRRPISRAVSIDQSASPSASDLKTNRKRRGEEQLLLDDHLLPAEMRRTGSLTGKRGKGKEPERGEEEGADEDEVEVQDEEAGGAEVAAEEDEEEEEEEGDEDEDEDEEGGADVTRCVCQKEDGPTMMIQCDKCNVWQHGPCVGIWKDEEAPEEYFCEQCRPELHGPLRKWIRSRGRNPINFLPPTPQDLERLHYASDRHPPSQSKRWTDPALMDPPIKPASRSHHRKEAQSPVVESTREGRRATASRAPLVPQHSGSKAVASTSVKREPEIKDRRQASKSHEPHRRVSSAGQPRSVSPIEGGRPSQSPPLRMEPKKRSTMNSRDAMYEEEVKAALEASRREMGLGEEEGESELGRRRRRIVGDEEEEESVVDDRSAGRKGKRKRDDDEGSVEPGAMSGLSSHKPKHPNQYTYRPKPPSSTAAVVSITAAASPARRGTPVPAVPIAPPAQHEHGTRRAEKLANGVHAPQVISTSVNNLHWHLPDYLSQCADLLSSSAPIPLEVRSARTMGYIPKNHFYNQRYGPWTEERGEDGKLLLPEEPHGREVTGQPARHLEPPARIRYPAKRITTAEMRKRVRNVLEYIGRVQAEESKRHERATAIGIDVKSLPEASRAGAEDEDEQDRPVARLPEYLDGAQRLKSSELMDELTRDLIAFQEGFANGQLGMLTPIPQAVAAFGEPVTPTLGTGADDEVVERQELAGGSEQQDQEPGAQPAVGEASGEGPDEAMEVEVVQEGQGMDVYREGQVEVVVMQPPEETVDSGISLAA